MNFIWGGLGALLGLWLASDRLLMGAGLGAALMLLLKAQRDLRRRLDETERELHDVRHRIPVAHAPAVAPRPKATPTPTDHLAPGDITPPTSARPVATREAVDASGPTTPTPQSPPRSTPLASPAGPVAVKRTPAAAAKSTPDVFDWLIGVVKPWFTEGNVPVKIGVLVLFAGVAAALRYAAAEGYFSFPIGVRLSLIALAALAALGWGWRERQSRPDFGLSLQGGAIGVLLLTIFAAFRLYGLLPAGLSFALVVVLVAGAAALAVLQRAMALAVLGFLGGYLAPVLISSGSHNHVALFSYYAVLNAAVFAISWRQHWRLLNLIGFAFTFGVGGIWGAKFYRPELLASVEPFLVLFYLFYVGIGLLYVLRQSSHRRPWLDGTLIFGTPLVAFPMQARLLHEQPMALAWSALVVAAIYAGLVYWLNTQRRERLLAEAYGALALGFVTLAVPLAFSAGATASLWALEGAAAAWLGLRQQRKVPWLAGLALQILAAGSYVLSQFDHHNIQQPLLLNATWLGAALIGVAGLLLALIHDRHRPARPLPALLMLWGLAWWSLAGLSQLEFAQDRVIRWTFAMGYLAFTVLAAASGRRWLQWPRLGWAMAMAAGFGLLSVLWASDRFAAALAEPTHIGWALYAVALLAALRALTAPRGRSLALAHTLGLWTLAAAATAQIDAQAIQASGWHFLAISAPLLLLTLGLWRRPQWLAWPRADVFQDDYTAGWFHLALPLLALFWINGLFVSGAVTPLAYLPLINPLELALLAIGVLLWACVGERHPTVPRNPIAMTMAFAWVSLGTLRAVHHGHGEPWSPAILDSGFSQTSLTVVWSLIGVVAWVAGSRRQCRPLWLAGALLMGGVLLKLVAVDRHYMGNMPGIVSFLAVGLLLVAVGYFAPSPPKQPESAA